MPLRNKVRNTPRDLPPIRVPSDMEVTGSGIQGAMGQKKASDTQKKRLIGGIRIPTEEGAVGEDSRDTHKPPDPDYIETNFRYMTIGSPVPDPEQSQVMVIPDVYNQDREPMTDDLAGDARDYTQRSQGNCSKGQEMGVLPRRKNKARKLATSTHPSIRIDSFDELSISNIGGHSTQESKVLETKNIERSYKGHLGSPTPSHLLLNPTPPLSHRRHRSKVVTYYEPSLTCSKSEGCIREVVRRDYDLNQDSEESKFAVAVGPNFTSHPYGNVRSSSCEPISIYNTRSLLSPQSYARETLAGSLLDASGSRINSSGQMSTPSPSVSPSCSPVTRRRHTHPERLGHYDHLPQIYW